LDELADAIRDQLDQFARQERETVDLVWRDVECYLAIGALLRPVRSQIPADREYGKWFRAQRFIGIRGKPFTVAWGWVLMEGAKRPDAVRAEVASQLASGRGLNIEKAIDAAKGKAIAARPTLLLPPQGDPVAVDLDSGLPGKFGGIVIDPAWPMTGAAGRGGYPPMSVDQIAALPVADWCSEDSHCYLWTPDCYVIRGIAYEVLEGWGLRLAGHLTWVRTTKGGVIRPGLGSTFRSCTETVLLGIRGKAPFARHDVNNVFFAPWRGHSRKPDEFFDIVESVSPGPYLEVFARRPKPRPGWTRWGNEAGGDEAA
jgi:N6-adenosine-specific RNA methylase IME4